MAGIEDHMFDINEEMKSRGLPELTDDVLKILAPKLAHPEVLSKIDSGEFPVSSIVDAVQAGLRATAEGSLFGAGRDERLERERKALGIKPPPQSLPQPEELP